MYRARRRGRLEQAKYTDPVARQPKKTASSAQPCMETLDSPKHTCTNVYVSQQKLDSVGQERGLQHILTTNFRGAFSMKVEDFGNCHEGCYRILNLRRRRGAFINQGILVVAEMGSNRLWHIEVGCR